MKSKISLKNSTTFSTKKLVHFIGSMKKHFVLNYGQFGWLFSCLGFYGRSKLVGDLNAKSGLYMHFCKEIFCR